MLSPENFSQIFLQQWQTGVLANFYLVQTTHPQSAELLASWAQAAGTQIIAQEEQISPQEAADIYRQSHPDVLVLFPQEHKYLLEDLAPFFSFLAIGRFSYRHRLAIIHQGELLSPIVANKLLKSLEDTPAHTTIVMLADASFQLLPTVMSRAVKINLAFPMEKQDGDSVTASLLETFCHSQNNWAEIINYCRGDREKQQAVLNWALDYCLQRQSSYQDKEQWLQALSHWEESVQFNNSSSERLIGILALITHGLH